MDDRLNRRNKAAFSKLFGVMWTLPKSCINYIQPFNKALRQFITSRFISRVIKLYSQMFIEIVTQPVWVKCCVTIQGDKMLTFVV